jgi:hypothetical protein
MAEMVMKVLPLMNAPNDIARELKSKIEGSTLTFNDISKVM